MSKRNLAPPALAVSAATATKAEYADAATANRVQQSEPVQVTPADAVDPAITYDDPTAFAPAAAAATEPAAAPSKISASALRAGSGAAFESYAAILRGAPEKNFLKSCMPCLYDERDFVTFGEVKKFAIIKGGNCFVFIHDTDLQPLYAIPLQEVYPVLENPNALDKCSVTVSPLPKGNQARKEMVTVMLKNTKDDSQAYQFTFDTTCDVSLPKRFMDAVEMASKKGGRVTASVVRADQMGHHAKRAQPVI